MIISIDKRKGVHDRISRQGLLECDTMQVSALVHVHDQCGTLCQTESALKKLFSSEGMCWNGQAQVVLEKLSSSDAVCWTALVAKYVQKGQGQHSLNCFGQMYFKGMLYSRVHHQDT